MAKFGKKLKSSMILEWQREYISYKDLKKAIKSIIKEIESRKTEKNNECDKTETEQFNIGQIQNSTSSNHKLLLSQPSTDRDLPEVTIIVDEVPIQPRQHIESSRVLEKDPTIKSTFNILFNMTNGDLVKNFLDKLDKEIKKFYLFYCTIERELYLQINTQLHRREIYTTFSLKDINKELESLVRISHVTKSFTLYINNNMMAIKKILKKFDKNFAVYFGAVTIKYLRAKLDQPSSDFNYMLQYKIVDEVSALIEDMKKDLAKVFWNKRKTSNKKVGSCNSLKDRESLKMSENSIDHPAYNEALVPNEHTDQSELESSIIDYNLGNKQDDKILASKIRRKLRELDNYTCGIDEIATFRSKIKDWNFYIKNGYKIVTNTAHFYQKESHKSVIISNTEDEEVIRKFLTSSDRSILYKDETLSRENKINIILSLAHTFLYMFIYSACNATNSEYLRVIDTNAIFSGMMLGLTPLAAILSTVLLSKWSNRNFKHPMIISTFLLIAGSFFYAFAYNLKSPELIALGRFLVGFGAARSVNRRYLTQFIPKNLITKNSFYYVLIGSLGLACGPFSSFLFLHLKEYDDLWNYFSFNKYTYSGWFGCVFALILFFLILCLYCEPLSDSFHMFEKDKEPRKFMTREEKTMIYEIDEKLNEINDENRFNDTNLVRTNIELIKNKQKSSFSYIYKCFFVLFSILFTIRVCNESLMVIFPLYMLGLGYSMDFVSLGLCFSLLLVIPSSLLFKKLTVKYPRERKLLIYLLIFCCIFSILIIDKIYESDIKYCICYVLLIILTNLIESLASSLLAKIIPPDWQLGTLNAGFMITISTTSGRTLGSFMQTISALIAGEEYIITITYGLCSFLFFIIIICFILNYSELRVKALARILKNQRIGSL